MPLNNSSNPPLTNRLATPPDAPHLTALINTAFRSERTGQTWLFDDQERRVDIVSTELINASIESPQSIFLTGIVHASDQPIACCCLTKPSDPPEPHRSDNAAWLGLLSVSPAHHKHGYGLAMLRAAENFVVEEWSAKRLELDVVSSRTELRAWYGRLGYEVTGARREFHYGEGERGILADGLELVVLGKSLVVAGER